MKEDRRHRFHQALQSFPGSARHLLQSIPQNGGKLAASACLELSRLLDQPPEDLMMRLLPLAKAFSTAPISEFHVGAVVLAHKKEDETAREMYLGANMEFTPMALQLTLHAEQTAVMNAWHQGAGTVKVIASSEPMCGFCRQFLNELDGGNDLVVMAPDVAHRFTQRQPLSRMLPEAIAPRNLKNLHPLMSPVPHPGNIMLSHESKDPLVAAALSAARASYAPYSGNLAGTAVETDAGVIVAGRYMESVAYNPSTSPLHSVMLRLNLMGLEQVPSLRRITLVEKPTRIRQKELAEMLTHAWAPGIDLEYYTAQEEDTS